MSYKLLLADDSITIQKVVELILADEGCDIKTANTGEEALALLLSFRPDIILADTDLPIVNGYELCKSVKQNPATNTIPVILLTGAFEPLDEDRARLVKSDDFLIKPFESEELIQKINAALAFTSSLQSQTPPVIASPYPNQIQKEEAIWNDEEAPSAVEAPPSKEEEVTVASTEELFEMSEEAAQDSDIAEKLLQETVSGDTMTRMAIDKLLADLPSKDEITNLFEKEIRERISSLFSSVDMKEALITSITPFIKDSVDKILWDLAPELIERMLKEILKGSLESLTAEVQKVIWETVPALAEKMISQEIERIKSEF